MNSSNFLVASLEFSMYSIMSSANSDSFYSSLMCIPLISFSSLIAMAQIFKTMLNKSGESGYLCLVLDVSGGALGFSPLEMMFAVGLLYMTLLY